MKRVATAIAAIALIGTPAFAADMAVKAPPAPAPVFSWAGWYVGGNFGGSWGRADTTWNYFAAAAVGSIGDAICPPAGGALCTGGSDTVNMNGPIGGVQIGYNWQSGNLLAGIEADFQGTGQSGTRELTASFPTTSSVNGATQGTAGASITERMPWLGTVRARLGYTANQWLLYATGGFAYGRVEVDGLGTVTGDPFGPPGSSAVCPNQGGFCSVWSSGNGVTKTGWTVGAGTEWALGGNWTARVEYLFVDLGSFNTTFTGLPGCFGVVVPGVGSGCSPFHAGIGSISTGTVTDNIVRLGLNYQFH